MAEAPWSKKRKRKQITSAARRAKASKAEVSANTESEGAGPSSAVDVVPEPNAEQLVESPSVGSGTDYESDADAFDDARVQDIFDDFILTLPLDDRRMLAVVLMESFRKRQKMQIVDASREAASIVGYCDKTVRRLRKQFFDNKGELDERKQGKYERTTVYRDEEINRKAAEWVRENSFIKGRPNMTAQAFCTWVNEKLLPSCHLPPHYPRRVGFRTAIRWLHHLGFKPVSHKKGVYIDGHEREDVVKHRKDYLKTMETLKQTHKLPPACCDEPPRIRQEEDGEKKTLVVLYHDESIYNTNDGQTWMWGEEDRPALLPKTRGSGIMVSDFVDEHNGYLRLSSDQQARVFLEYGSERDGYWTGDRFLEQMKTACDIVDVKYPVHSHTVVFVLDQSSCHRKFADKALIVRNILVKDGGTRRVRDTVWAGQPQLMVLPNGSAKGLRTILAERGINTATLRADEMRTILSYHEDFLFEKTQVEHYVNNRGFKCLFIPKFHCELNPIERVWGQSKRYCRAHTNYTLVKLRQILNPALDSVPVEMIRKYFRKAREYERAYREGRAAGKDVETAVKLYKSHRRVFTEDIGL